MHIKKMLITVVAITLLFVSPIYFRIVLSEYRGEHSKYYISDFNLYKNDFQTIADKMMTLNDLSNSSESYSVWIDSENNQVSCKLNGKEIEMMDEEKEALKNVLGAFDKATILNRITIYKNRVTFCTAENMYAVAYMTDDSKPEFMNSPEESFNIKVKKIEMNWYNIIN